MIARIRRNWRLSVGLCCITLALLLCLGGYKVFGQIPPVPLSVTNTTVAFVESSYTVAQGDTAYIAVVLNAASTGTVTVNYATSDGTGQAGVDYTAASGTLTYPPGSTEQYITVATMVDPNGQTSLTFNVTLSSPSGGDMGSPSTATVYMVTTAQLCGAS